MNVTVMQTDQFVKLVKDVQHKLKEPGAFNQVITRVFRVLASPQLMLT